jgi:anaerobic ribonucleoside-triphosphate reductase activating protein
VPETHDPAGGVELPVADAVAAALDPVGAPRDGVTITGGEPFLQSEGLLALVRGLRAGGCRHLLCYSGYTLAALRARSAREPAIAGVLDAIDLLVDGPYLAAAASTGGRWTGSGNQRVLAPRHVQSGSRTGPAAGENPRPASSRFDAAAPGGARLPSTNTKM